jgi:D-beta-D-heptose 7-phosphate kinase/D-beta-D-heptose 1-phosphate adenosyltransferase
MSAKILVIGDVMLDEYIIGNCDRVSPEAPVLVLGVNSNNIKLGGACNVANNLATLGIQSSILSVIGNNKKALRENKTLTKLLDEKKISHYLIKQKHRQTTIKTRVMANSHQIVRIDKENNDDISDKSCSKLLKVFSEIVTKFDVILLSDYNKGVLTTKVTKQIIQIANKANKKTLIDPKGKDYSKYKNAYLLTPNKKEIQTAFGIDINTNNKKSLDNALAKLKDININIPLVTLSEDGIGFLQNKIIHKYKTVAVEVFDVTGAGDTVLASLGYGVANNWSIKKSVEFANIAAGVVVAKIGAQSASLSEIEAYKNHTLSSNKIKTNKIIKLICDDIHFNSSSNLKQKKIIFTNGCFDILHSGHITYLQQAKNLGDILIVGLNSDESVKRLKGDSRPINKEHDRALVLSALECVDFVVIFNQDTPYELIKVVVPDVLVKGGDYTKDNVVGNDIAKKVKIMSLVKEKSTTNIISKIQTS